MPSFTAMPRSARKIGRPPLFCEIMRARPSISPQQKSRTS
jgi:hypothetical protein